MSDEPAGRIRPLRPDDNMEIVTMKQIVCGQWHDTFSIVGLSELGGVYRLGPRGWTPCPMNVVPRGQQTTAAEQATIPKSGGWVPQRGRNDEEPF